MKPSNLGNMLATFAMVCFLATSLGIHAEEAESAGPQDGSIVEKSACSLMPEIREKVLARVPQVAEFIDSNKTYAMTYMSDGLKVKGYLVIPPGEGPFPCLICNRGGNREFGAISDPDAIVWLGKYASWGYIVVASNYRGVAGGEGMEEFGGAEIDDVLNLIPLLESIPQADTTRIGMWGGSRGGLMTYIALRKTDRIRGAVVAAGLSDSFMMIKDRPEMETGVIAELVPDYEANKEAALLARSPVRWANELCKTTPLLVFQGSGDWRVNPEEALEMADALLAAKHPFRFILFEGADHGLTEFRSEEDRITRDFLDHYVRDMAPLPDLEPHGR